MAKLHSITRHGAHVIKINQAFLLLSRVFGPTPILHKRKAWDRGYKQRFGAGTPGVMSWARDRRKSSGGRTSHSNTLSGCKLRAQYSPLAGER